MLRDLKNHMDFYLRNQLRIGRALPVDTPVHPKALKLQNEILEFIELFSWSSIRSIHIVDVGARTFSFAPAFENFFSKSTQSLMLTGIEIDAYRRFTDLRTRRDYGEYYAKKVSNGRYLPFDFLKFNEDVDIVMMLHPFVTLGPHIEWGLPKSKFKPQSLFAHGYKILEKNNGMMLLSNPTSEEFIKSKNLCIESGFKVVEEHQWHPRAETIQQQPRFGALLKID